MKAKFGARHFVVTMLETRIIDKVIQVDLGCLAGPADGLPWLHLHFRGFRVSLGHQVPYKPVVAENLHLLRSDWWLQTSERVINF